MSVGEIYVNVQGRLGSDVEFRYSSSGVAMASFRLGCTPRHRVQGAWTDKATTWLTVECWRHLAENIGKSLSKGQPVVVVGRLKTNEWTDDNERRSRLVIEATSIGHDLTRGTAEFTKTASQANQPGDSLTDEMAVLSEDVERAEYEDAMSGEEAEELATVDLVTQRAA